MSFLWSLDRDLLSLSLSLFARVGWLDVGTDVLPMLTQQVQLVATRR
jgi:hypothetical protein